MLYDEALDIANSFGKYQIFLVFTVGLALASELTIGNFVYVFISAVPDHSCFIPGFNLQNLTHGLQKNVSIPVEEDGTFSRCKMFDLKNTSLVEAMHANSQETPDLVTVDCKHGWTYDRSVYKSSITTDWDLVCQKRSIATVSQSVFMTALGLGAITSGYVSDNIGRRRTLQIFVVFQSLSFVASAFSVNIFMFIIFAGRLIQRAHAFRHGAR